jgi:hypothetical protein
LRKSVNGLQKVFKTFDRIMKRLPSTYPQAHLVIHRDSECLKTYYLAHEPEDDKDFELVAFCDAPSDTIHLHMDIQKETCRDIASYILHEMGHLYGFHKHGGEASFLDDEGYADGFAARWVRRLDKEDWF